MNAQPWSWAFIVGSQQTTLMLRRAFERRAPEKEQALIIAAVSHVGSEDAMALKRKNGGRTFLSAIPEWQQDASPIGVEIDAPSENDDPTSLSKDVCWQSP